MMNRHEGRRATAETADEREARIERAVRAALDAPEDSRCADALRGLVAGHAAARRAEGATPEAAIIDLKECLGRAAHSTGSVEARDLRERLVRWCIEAYFRAD